jgi:hypothetical protein
MLGVLEIGCCISVVNADIKEITENTYLSLFSSFFLHAVKPFAEIFCYIFFFVAERSKQQ